MDYKIAFEEMVAENNRLRLANQSLSDIIDEYADAAERIAELESVQETQRRLLRRQREQLEEADLTCRLRMQMFHDEHQEKLDAEYALHNAKIEHKQQMATLQLRMQRDAEAHAEVSKNLYLTKQNNRHLNETLQKDLITIEKQAKEILMLREQIRQDNTALEKLRNRDF